MIDKILQKFGYRKISKRNYAGASNGRLYASWTTMNRSADAELRMSLKTLRARSRELERNNDYAKRYFNILQKNVIGKNGILLQARVKNTNGQPDRAANQKIETAWKNWIRKGLCDITGKYSFRDVQNIVLRSTARDGEILVRLIRNAQNPFNFSIQLIEADHLDEYYNANLSNGNKIRMGVELNKLGRPIAYWLWKVHPGDLYYADYSYFERVRVPAEEIIHVFLPTRASQNRGVPWLHTAMTRLNMLGAYEEAELTAARIGASKMGFYKNENGDEYQGDDVQDNSPIMEVEPGIFEVLPRGWDVTPFDPDHPNTAFKDFEKAILRGIASGADVNYNNLANDLESTSYSSIRAGTIEERETWKDLQTFMIEHFLQPVFDAWLEMALLTKQVDLPFSKKDKFNAVKWQPRGFSWVDPLKDVTASIAAIKAGIKTATDVAAEQGRDIEEVYEQLAIEKQLREKYGITTEFDAKLLEILSKSETEQ